MRMRPRGTAKIITTLLEYSVPPPWPPAASVNGKNASFYFNSFYSVRFAVSRNKLSSRNSRIEWNSQVLIENLIEKRGMLSSHLLSCIADTNTRARAHTGAMNAVYVPFHCNLYSILFILCHRFRFGCLIYVSHLVDAPM